MGPEKREIRPTLIKCGEAVMAQRAIEIGCDAARLMRERACEPALAEPGLADDDQVLVSGDQLGEQRVHAANLSTAIWITAANCRSWAR